jgi:hypothetical protein
MEGDAATSSPLSRDILNKLLQIKRPSGYYSLSSHHMQSEIRNAGV